MPLASRPNLALKSKQDINPSIDRNTEATAQDFADYNAILEDHANLIDDLSKAYAAATFYGIRGSLALFQAEFPDAVEGYGVIDPGNGNPQIIAEVTNGVWTATANVAPIQRFNNKLERPQPGIEDVIYVVKDEKILSLWYDGSYKDFGKDGYNGKSTYQIALDFGFVGTEPQWLVSMKGTSAYQTALDNGFSGTEAAWLISLEGIAGKSAYEVAVDEGFVGTQADWVVSLGGIPGKSAYEVAVDQGFVGTEAEWIASIEGVEGKSAYEVAVAGGFVGTEAEWLISIEGAQGVIGPDGDSAYQVWLNAGNVGTEQDYIDSLQGAPGADGTGTSFKTDLEASNTKATPIDADIFGYLNSAASNVLVKFTWANIKTALGLLFSNIRLSNIASDLSAAEILAFLTKIGLTNTKDYDVIPVSVSRSFLASDSGKTLIITAAVTLTMPASLSTKFRCEIDVKAAGLCTMVMASGVTWTGGAGLILDPQKMCTIYAEALNTYRIKGETKA